MGPQLQRVLHFALDRLWWSGVLLSLAKKNKRQWPLCSSGPGSGILAPVGRGPDSTQTHKEVGTRAPLANLAPRRSTARGRAPPPVLLPSFLLTFVFIPRARFEEAHAPCLTLTFVYVPQPVLTTGTYIVSFSKGD